MKNLFTTVLSLCCFLLFLNSFAQKEAPSIGGGNSNAPNPSFSGFSYFHNVVVPGGLNNGIKVKSTSQFAIIDVESPTSGEAGIRFGSGNAVKWSLYNTTTDNLILHEFGIPSRGFTIGKTTGYFGLGIGYVAPLSRLHVAGGNWDVANTEGDVLIGDATYRLKIGVATGGGGAGDARIFATGGTNRIIFGNGNADRAALFGANFGIGLIAPTAKFHISHDTEADDTKPHMKLTQSADGNNGRIRMENFDGTKYFMERFDVSGVASTDYNLSWGYGGSVNLNIRGDGQITNSGFTKLGSNAPAIKVLKLTGTTSASSSSNSLAIPHSLNRQKILGVVVLVNYGSGTVKDGNNYSGYQFDFYITDTDIYVYNQASSSSILNKPFTILVTYEE